MCCCSPLTHQQRVQMSYFDQKPSLSSCHPKGAQQKGFAYQFFVAFVINQLLYETKQHNANVIFIFSYLHQKENDRKCKNTCVFLLFHLHIFHILPGLCSASSGVNTLTSAVTSIKHPNSMCLSPAYSPLCHFRVIWMWCRNVQISCFGPQHIPHDYPQAARLPVRPLVLPLLIRLTEALHLWPRPLSQTFHLKSQPTIHSQSEQLFAI